MSTKDYSNPGETAKNDAAAIRANGPNTIMHEIWTAHEHLKNDPAAYNNYVSALKGNFQGQADTANLHAIELDDARAQDPNTEKLVAQVRGLNSKIAPESDSTYFDVLDMYAASKTHNDTYVYAGDRDGKVSKEDIEQFKSDAATNPRSFASAIAADFNNDHPNEPNFFKDLPKDGFDQATLLAGLGLKGDSAKRDFDEQFSGWDVSYGAKK